MMDSISHSLWWVKEQNWLTSQYWPNVHNNSSHSHRWKSCIAMSLFHYLFSFLFSFLLSVPVWFSGYWVLNWKCSSQWFYYHHPVTSNLPQGLLRDGRPFVRPLSTAAIYGPIFQNFVHHFLPIVLTIAQVARGWWVGCPSVRLSVC